MTLQTWARRGTVAALGAALAVALTMLAGCGGGPTDVDGEVRAVRVAGGVEIANGTGHGIAYAVYNPNWLGLLATCADPGPACVRLAPGARVVVPEREFAGWEGSPPAQQKLSVLWWRVVATPGGYAAVDVRELPVVE